MEEMEFGNNFHFNQIKYQTSGFENRLAGNNKEKEKNFADMERQTGKVNPNAACQLCSI